MRKPQTFKQWGAGVFALLVTAALAVGCAQSEKEERADVPAMTQGERVAAVDPADAALMSEVERKLNADPQTSAAKIDVQVTKGTITLTGEVQDEEQKRKAEELAKDVEGVDRVDNRLVVAPS